MNATKDMTAHGGAEKYQAMYPIDPSLLSIITNVRGSVTRTRLLAVGECARTKYSVLSLQYLGVQLLIATTPQQRPADGT